MKVASSLALGACCVALAFDAAPAAAGRQSLNLGQPAPATPDPMRGTLLAEAEALDRAAAMPGAPDDPRTAQALLRRVGALLLTQSFSTARDASSLWVLGRAVAAHRFEFDALLNAPARADAPARVALALGAIVDAPGAEQPADIGEWEVALRDALAPLWPEPGAGLTGWPAPAQHATDAGAAAPPSLASLAAPMGLAEADAVAWIEGVTALRLRAETPGLRAQALADERLLRAASAALVAPPRWLGPALVAPLRSDLARAATALGDPARERTARAALRRGVSVDRAARALDAPSVNGAGPGARRAREALAGVLAPRADAPPADPGAIDAMARLAEVAGAPLPARDAPLLRQLRPALPALSARARDAQRALLELVAELPAARDPGTDPAVLAAFNAASRARDDVALLTRVSAMLAQPSAPGARGVALPARPGLEPLAGALLPLAQGLSAGRATDERVAQFRAALRAVEAMLEVPGEASLRAEPPDELAPARDGLLAGRGAEVLAQLDTQRTAWRAAFVATRPSRPAPRAPARPASPTAPAPRSGSGTSPGSGAPSTGGPSAGAPNPFAAPGAGDDAGARRVLRVAALLALLDDAAEADAGRALGLWRLDAFAGWQLSPGAWEALRAEVRPRLRRAAEAVLRNDDRADAVLAETASALAPALLAGRLNRLLRGVVPPAPEGATHQPAHTALARVGAGVPAHDALVVEHRAALARVCRALEAWHSHAPAGGVPGAGPGADARREADALARRVLDTLPRAERPPLDAPTAR